MFLSKRWLAMLALPCLFAAGCLASSSPGPGEAKVEYGKPAPGKEVALHMPQAKSYLKLWLPENYTPDRKWPVIFCYPGYGMAAITWPFRQVTDGKDFICVGMNYATAQWRVLMNLTKVGPELAYFKEAWEIVNREASIAPSMVFMGGFSLGGYTTSVMGETMLDKLAGMIIIAGGRFRSSADPPNKEEIRNKPIYIAAGSRDWLQAGRAREGADIYRRFGADVTYQVWPNLTHQADTHDKKLTEWLLNHSLLRDADARLTKAKALENAGKFGQAYVIFDDLGQITDIDPRCVAAAKAAKAIKRQATRSLGEAERAIDRKQFERAEEILADILRTYEGSDFARQAKLLAPLAAPRKPSTKPASPTSRSSAKAAPAGP